jgi:hypothetical protein
MKKRQEEAGQPIPCKTTVKNVTISRALPEEKS